MIGIPVLIVTLVAFGITSIYPASKTQKTALMIVATPLLLGGLLVLGDTISSFQSNIAMGAIYLFLLVAVFYAAYSLLSRPIAVATSEQSESSHFVQAETASRLGLNGSVYHHAKPRSGPA